MKYNKPDKRLRKLIGISDKLESRLDEALDEVSDVKSYKDLTAAIKEAVSIRRDLLDIPPAAAPKEKPAAKEEEESGALRVEISTPEYSE